MKISHTFFRVASILCAILPASVFAYDMPVNYSNEFETNCDGGVFRFDNYINTSHNYRDKLLGDPSYNWFIDFDESNLTIVNPYNALSLDRPYWYRSNIQPMGVSEVVIAATSPYGVHLSAHAPSHDTPAAQLVFRISRYATNTTRAGQYLANYTTTGDGAAFLTSTLSPRPDWSTSTQEIDNECFNVYVHWCGDGVRDGASGTEGTPDYFAGEQCDPNDASHSGWGTGGCNASCQPVTTTQDVSCSGITVVPRMSTGATLTANVSCVATGTAPVTGWQVNCGNGTTQDAGTNGTATCSYTATGTYTAQCLLNEQTTTPAICQENVTVGNDLGSSACNTLTASPTSARNSLTSTLSCSTTNPLPTDIFRIDCGNGQTLNAATGTCSYTSIGSYTARCYVNDETTTPSRCEVPLQVTRGGGGGSSCVAGSISGTLSAPIEPFNYTNTGLCQYTTQTPGGFNTTVSGRTTTYSWSCDGNSGGSCSATYTTSGGSSGGGNRCGDGIIQRPNDQGQMEECDAGPLNGTSGVLCSNTCTIRSGGGSNGWSGSSTTNPRGQIQNIFTNPRGSSMEIPVYSVIIGQGVPVFRNNQAITFKSQYPIFVDESVDIKIQSTNQSHIVGTTKSGLLKDKLSSSSCLGTSCCIGSGDMVIRTQEVSSTGAIIYHYNNVSCQSGEVTLFSNSELQDFKAAESISELQSQPYINSEDLVTSVKWFSEPIKIRISQPIVSNTAGGNAYLGAAAGARINDIANSFIENLKKGNFTTAATVVDGTNNWSDTRTTTGSGNASTKGISAFTRQSSGANTLGVQITTDNFSALHALGDNENIRVLDSGNLEIMNPIALSGVKTIVVKQGNLVIDGDLTYLDENASVAFVIEEGDIIVKNNVKRISGVFIALKGSIKGEGVNTSNTLYVDGNIYGNVNELVGNRTYVRGDTVSQALTTGVTINYSARALKNPPPLLTEFLDRYSLSKVVK